MYTHTHIQIHAHTCLPAAVWISPSHKLTCIHSHSHTHTYSHTHTHTHTHTQPFDGGLGSFKLCVLLARFLKHCCKDKHKQDAGAVLQVCVCVCLCVCICRNIAPRSDIIYLPPSLPHSHTQRTKQKQPKPWPPSSNTHMAANNTSHRRRSMPLLRSGRSLSLHTHTHIHTHIHLHTHTHTRTAITSTGSSRALKG